MTKTQTQKPLVDVPADNPEGTLDRFTVGLRRVLSVPKRDKTRPSKPKARSSTA
jgi:hypothetical protein